MNKGLLIILVLIGAVGLLCMCGIAKPAKRVEPPVVTAVEEPTIEERAEGYMLADEGMTSDLSSLEERDYVNPEDAQPVDGVVGFGGDAGSAL